MNLAFGSALTTTASIPWGSAPLPRGAPNDFIMNAQGSDDAWNGVWEVKSQSTKAVGPRRFGFLGANSECPPFQMERRQVWGMNIWRTVRRSREETVWNALDPTMEGMVNQGGILRGIEGVNTPPRIALFPYVSAYSTTALDDTAHAVGQSGQWGLDAKVGIGDAFTVDMTLVPDFGQVVTDNLVLNLSPFEVQFAENRPFFLEAATCSTKVVCFTADASDPKDSFSMPPKSVDGPHPALELGCFRRSPRHHRRRQCADFVQCDCGRSKPAQQWLRHRASARPPSDQATDAMRMCKAPNGRCATKTATSL